MNRYKPVGWRNDSYRHSLAAKGVRTSFLGKKSQLLNNSQLLNWKYKVPDSETINTALSEYKNANMDDRVDYRPIISKAIDRRRQAKKDLDYNLDPDSPPEDKIGLVVEKEIDVKPREPFNRQKYEELLDIAEFTDDYGAFLEYLDGRQDDPEYKRFKDHKERMKYLYGYDDEEYDRGIK